MAFIETFNLTDFGAASTSRVVTSPMGIEMNQDTTPAHDTAQRNKQLVISHFDDFVNRKDLSAIDRNMAPDFLDHDGPGGKAAGISEDRAMMAAMHALIPDLHVEVKDAIAEADKVVVRNLWTGTNSRTGEAIQFHGFVLWRIENAKIAERWATVTPMQLAAAQSLGW
jgi:predicted ester cyclase